MTSVKYSIPAIHCMHCTHTIEMELRELAGVQSVKTDLGTKQVEIAFDAPASEEKIKALLNELNYPVGGLTAL